MTKTFVISTLNNEKKKKVFSNFHRNVQPHSPECLTTFPGMFDDTPRNVSGHSPKCLAIFPGMFEDILRNVWQYPLNVSGHSPEFLRILPGIFGDISRNITFPSFPEFSEFRSPFLYSQFYTSSYYNYFHSINVYVLCSKFSC